MGGHVFLEYMSFRITHLMRAYAIRVVMLCRRKCHVGGHDWWSACLQDGISYNMFCFTGKHFLLEEMFYLRVYFIGEHVLQLEMSYWGTCFIGGHILSDDLSYMRTPLG